MRFSWFRSLLPSVLFLEDVTAERETREQGATSALARAETSVSVCPQPKGWHTLILPRGPEDPHTCAKQGAQQAPGRVQ